MPRHLATLALLACAFSSSVQADTRALIDRQLASQLPPELGFGEHLSPHFRYEPLPDSYTQDLRRACRHCHSIDLSLHIPGREPFDLRLSRGGAENAAFHRLLGVIMAEPTWYLRRSPGVEIEHGFEPVIHLQDAKGRALMSIVIYPEGAPFARRGEQYLSLWELCRRALPRPQSEVDARAIAIARYNASLGEHAPKPCDPATHRIRVEQPGADLIESILRIHPGLTEAELADAVCVTISKPRKRPALGGGDYHCIINIKTGEVVATLRDR